MISDNPHNITRKKNKPWFSIIMTIILLALVPIVYIYGPVLYHRYSGDSQYRIEQQNIKWARKIHSTKYDPLSLIDEITQAQKVVEIIQNNKPMDANVRILGAMLIFYKMMIRMPVNDDNLMQLTGRGYMPASRKIQNEKTSTTPVQSAKKLMVTVRRAFAIDPELDHKNQANLLILYGDFIFTGRTDPHLLVRLDQIKSDELPDHLKPWYQWIAIALYTLMGETQKSREIIKSIASTDNSKQTVASQNLFLSEANRQLILCHGFYYSKRYLQALQQARFVKNNKLLTPSIRAEAARMEAEIFLIQRGKASARYFFLQALEIGKIGDPFIQSRIDEISQ